jgi:D-glycero-D-manno-heptose 1,7-bisphosphate phosphatase
MTPVGTTGAVFLDRDGTLNEKPREDEYVTRPEELRLLPGVAAAIRRLNEANAKVIIVTNQRGVARGLMTMADVDAIHTKLTADIAAHGARVDAIYTCPHEADTCECRKPKPGLLLRAITDAPELRTLPLFLVGDSVTDVEAGRAVGAKTVLVGQSDSCDRAPASMMATDMTEAVRMILDDAAMAHG